MIGLKQKKLRKNPIGVKEDCRQIPVFYSGEKEIPNHSDLLDLNTSGHPAIIISFNPSSTSLSAHDVQAALEEILADMDDYILISEKGAPNGVVPLESDSHFLENYLPRIIDGGTL